MDFKMELKLLLSEQDEKQFNNSGDFNIAQALSPALHRVKLVYSLLEYCGAKGMYDQLIWDLAAEKITTDTSLEKIADWVESSLDTLKHVCTDSMYRGAVKYALIVIQMSLTNGGKNHD